MWELKHIGRDKIIYINQFSEQAIKFARFTPLSKFKDIDPLSTYDRLDVRLFLDRFRLGVKFHRLEGLRKRIDSDRELLREFEETGDKPKYLEESLRNNEKIRGNQAIDIFVQRRKNKGEARDVCSTAPLTKNELERLWPEVILVVESLPDKLVEPFKPKEEYLARARAYRF